ncbi:hypothetical protein C8F01DRAFT_1080496 [Mycena amicta]|nr:hypothetical protein C8F01DRAFT_1080496 [Mycena amicta]
MLVAGTTAGATVLVFLIFAVIFLHVRGRQRRREVSDAMAMEERKGKGAGGVGMLDGEDFADSVEGTESETDTKTEMDMMEPVPKPTPEPAVVLPSSISTARLPFLFPARTSDSGSAFREEVWPPPREESLFVDPLLQIRNGGDLARIVTDVMGLELGAVLSVEPDSAGSSTPGQTQSATTVSDDDPPWPPTPTVAPPLPVAYPSKSRDSNATKSPRPRPPHLVRPSTGDGVPNWLERTPRVRRPGTAPGDVGGVGMVRRAASDLT